MALRLTGTVSSLAAPTDDDESLAAGLLAGARAALAGDDVAAYHASVARTEEIEDPGRRDTTALELLELGLVHARRVTDQGAIRAYAAVADAGLSLLQRAPAEPLLLNYTGVACYELWALDAAGLLFKAAARLDPELPNLARNRAELAGRRRAGRPGRPLHASVAGLQRRAARIVRQARPTHGLRLSLCMIVKDEEAMLGRCLAAAAPAVDEIIVVDTGSQDATIEIARSFGARVIEHPWTGSFADARNVSFEAATGDWLLYLDADEVLVAEDVARLRELTGHTWREAFHLIETSFTGELEDGTAVVNSALRMFRNRPGYRFEGTLHEQIAHTLPATPGRIGHTSVRIEHYGYLGDVRAAKEKSARNLALLREELRTTSAPTPFLHFNLGCEYAAVGQHAAAARELSQAWEMLEAAGEMRVRQYAPTLTVTLVRALRLGGHPREAIDRAQRALELFDDFTDLVLEWAAAAGDLGDAATAVALCERCLELGDAPARYGGMVGAGTHLPRLALARLALRDDAPGEAAQWLEWCLVHRPAFHAVAGPYAQARLATGGDGAAVVDELESRLDALPATARRVLARTLATAGAREAAIGQYRQAITGTPGAQADGARVALAELLLATGGHEECAALAAEVAQDGPFGALGCRIETAARICTGDTAGARRALGRAGGVSLSRPEHAALEAWIDCAEGGSSRAGLATASIPLIAALLELTIRAGEGTQAQRLAALIERSRLAPREQAELVAEIHRRTGNLAGAARLWLAVCAREPDARARLGLARVAAAQGLTEDAAVFCASALELDPGCADARALLAQLPSATLTAGALDG